MADPDLQIRGGGVGHPDHKIRGGGLKNFFFLPFGPQFGLEVSGAGCGGGGGRSPRAPPLDSPPRTAFHTLPLFYLPT